MRWKLLIIASLLAAVVGAGATLGIVFGLWGSARRLARIDPVTVAALLLPVMPILYASFFVYRHTARRRQLQAAVTALLASLLTLTIFFFLFKPFKLTGMLTKPELMRSAHMKPITAATRERCPQQRMDCA
jgi:hypothetical protein